MSRIDFQLRRLPRAHLSWAAASSRWILWRAVTACLRRLAAHAETLLTTLAWLGWVSMPVARLGCDKPGHFVASDMKSAGVNSNHLQRSEAVPTPVVIQQFVEGANGIRRHRFSLVCPECGAWLPRYRSVLLTHAREAIQGLTPKAFYFDRVSPATVAMAEWAKKNGAVVLFEPSSIGEDSLFERAVDACDILKFSNERFSRIRSCRRRAGQRSSSRRWAQTACRRAGRGGGAPLSRLSHPRLLMQRGLAIGAVLRSYMCLLREEHKASGRRERRRSNELCDWAKHLRH